MTLSFLKVKECYSLNVVVNSYVIILSIFSVTYRKVRKKKKYSDEKFLIK